VGRFRFRNSGVFTTEHADTEKIWLLYIQKTAACLRGRDWAGIVAAEDAVAGAGDEIVSPVANGTRDEAEDESGEAPRAAELFKHKEDRVRARQKRFVGLAAVDHNICGVEIGWIGAVTGEDASCERALQRGEAKVRRAVVAKNELNVAVAESADAVVEEDGVGHRFGSTAL
jgi:hypothetical protein